MLNSRLIKLPTPASLTAFWNFGSLLRLCLVTQLITGVFLSIQYSGSLQGTFETVTQISFDVNYGWWLRVLHANGASLFFLMIYCHIGRGIYYISPTLKPTWLSGSIILILVIATAFLGYVLPWGQMSFWGATVITNLISAIPYVGQDVVIWLWGGFSVGGATLTRFLDYTFCYLSYYWL